MGNLHFVQRGTPEGTAGVLGLEHLDDLFAAPDHELKAASAALLDRLGLQCSPPSEARPERAVFCSRTLNLRAIATIGYDLGAPSPAPGGRAAATPG